MPNQNASNSNGKGARKRQNSKKVANHTRKKKINWKAFKKEFEFSSQLFGNSIELNLPLRTVSEANTFEHWSYSHQRHKLQKDTVALALKPLAHYIKLPCEIKLIRYAPETLDKFENLPMSFKYIVDACCAHITGDFRPGRADSDERISLSCDQVKSKGYGVKILITF